MESSGEAFKIHVSQATYYLLQRLGGYTCVERGIIPIKVGALLGHSRMQYELDRQLRRINFKRILKYSNNNPYKRMEN